MKRLYALLLGVVMIVCSAVPVLGADSELSEEGKKEAINELYSFVKKNGSKEQKEGEIIEYSYPGNAYQNKIVCYNNDSQTVYLVEQYAKKISFPININDNNISKITYSTTLMGGADATVDFKYSEYNGTTSCFSNWNVNYHTPGYAPSISFDIECLISSIQRILRENTNLSLQKLGFANFDGSEIEKISMKHKRMTLFKGDQLQLDASIYPESAIVKKILWSSSDDSIAKVSSTGLVTACSAGEATITVSTEDGFFSDTCIIFVKSDGNEEPEPKPEPKPAPSEPDSKDQISDFVSRMYTVALGREAETKGLNDWSIQLKEGKSDGATLARGFISSGEFMNKGLSNEQFVDVLYHTFFNRDPDEAGKTGWLNALSGGTSRESVLAGFVNSQEFANLCDGYGIPRGTMEDDGSNIYNAGVRDFVLRNYEKALGRKGETAGVEDWAHRINTKQMSALDVAQSFFHSEEFLNKNTSNEEFVEILYETFLGRPSDDAGKADWVGQLNDGKDRDEVMKGFAYSQEFHNIMAQYGL